MSRVKIILLTAFVLVLSAGMVVGRLSAQLPVVKAERTGPAPSWLADELNLTPDQRKQMDAIWADAKPKMDKLFERRQELDRERDQAIQDLLTPAEWTAYGKIMDDFHSRRADCEKQRLDLMQDASAHSRALLSDSQLQKWDALRNSRSWRGPRGPENQRSSTTMPAVGDGDGNRP